MDFMYHFTPLTCCTTILENEEGGKKGRGAVDAHMVLTAGQQVQGHLLSIFICSIPAGICGMNLLVDHYGVLL